MRTLAGFAVALVVSGSAFAQYRGNFSNSTNVVTGSVPRVVFPGGTPGAHIGGQRVAFDGGAGRRTAAGAYGSYGYAYPVYLGSYGSAYDSSLYGAPGQGTQQPNITIIMPPQQPPVIINQFDAPARPQMTVYQPGPDSAPPAQADDSAAEPPHYLLAFKDHTIYSAVAYWVDGDTLHYFTAGNTHNQVSVSLIDRAMTERLNKDAGVDVKLPPAK